MNEKAELPKIVGFIGMTEPGSTHREITHVEMSDGTTLPVDKVTPRMWAEAGLSLAGQNEH